MLTATFLCRLRSHSAMIGWVNRPARQPSPRSDNRRENFAQRRVVLLELHLKAARIRHLQFAYWHRSLLKLMPKGLQLSMQEGQNEVGGRKPTLLVVAPQGCAARVVFFFALALLPVMFFFGSRPRRTLTHGRRLGLRHS